MAKIEWEKIKLVKRNPSKDCLTCDYLVDSKCSIYNDRPFMCRLYGATTDAAIACPHGCAPNKPLSAKQAAILRDKYKKLVGDNPRLSVDVA